MVNVAILGFGTVGSGVAEVLAKNAEHIDQKVETPVRLKYILDVRDFPGSPFEDKVVHDFSVIENDPTVEIVVEPIGGATLPLEPERALAVMLPYIRHVWARDDMRAGRIPPCPSAAAEQA